MAGQGTNGNSGRNVVPSGIAPERDVARTFPVNAAINLPSGTEAPSAESSPHPPAASKTDHSGSHSRHRSGSRQRRREKTRRRERRRIVLAIGLVLVELLGFSLANFAAKDSWAELGGFLLLQPLQIAMNGFDAHFQFTRGLRDEDAVLLVTLLSLPLNLLLWYGVWRGWRALRRQQRRRSHAPGGTHGPALPVRHPVSRSWADSQKEELAVAARLPHAVRGSGPVSTATEAPAPLRK